MYSIYTHVNIKLFDVEKNNKKICLNFHYFFFFSRILQGIFRIICLPNEIVECASFHFNVIILLIKSIRHLAGFY